LISSYPGAIGVKSGYTSFAHNTLIAAATRNGRTILVTLMGTRRNIYEQARLMLDWGFAHPKATPVGTLVSPLPSGLLYGSAPRSTTVTTDPMAMGVPTPAHRRIKLAGAAAGLLVLVVAGRRRRREQT
jgi:D-alanyl-D-alanine carboxypeptidase (penicillin-binding protein 5/6)